MHDAHHKSFDRLTGKRSSRSIAHRHRKHHFERSGRFILDFLVSAESRLGIQRIENRFDENRIHAGVHKNVDLFVVSRFEFIESDTAARRVVHIFAHREHFACRTDVA